VTYIHRQEQKIYTKFAESCINKNQIQQTSYIQNYSWNFWHPLDNLSIHNTRLYAKYFKVHNLTSQNFTRDCLLRTNMYVDDFSRKLSLPAIMKLIPLWKAYTSDKLANSIDHTDMQVFTLDFSSRKYCATNTWTNQCLKTP
jgi:hypothetical protein